MDRRIAHLDMDAFYASVELLRYPELRGQPVVIGGRQALRSIPHQQQSRFARLREYAGRGVVTTATYEARAYGVHSAMGLMKAAALAPDAFLLPADFERYRHYSRLFKSAVAAIAPQIEDRSIDEIYIDLSEVQGEAVLLAERLKSAVRQATGLSCSIGIAPNKLLAKLASELDKPDGLTILTAADIPHRIWPLPVGKVNGIGPKTNARLQALGINLVGELAATAVHHLVAAFGERQGRWLSDLAHGRDDRPIETFREPRSLSRETTFERDLHPIEDRPTLSQILLNLCLRLQDDLKRKGYRGKTVGIKIRFDDFQTLTRDFTMEHATAEAEAIRQAARVCLRRVRLDRRIRLLGVRIGSLCPEAAAESSEQEATRQPVGHACNLRIFD
jgi:DNA polymerase IV